MWCDAPADDHPTVSIGDEADVRDPCPGSHVRQVGDPQLVRRGGGEISSDQVRVPIRAGGGAGGPHPLATADTFDAEYVAIDPAAVYAKAVRTPGLLPHATLVVDHFHLVQLANVAVTKVRRRVTWELKDRRGGKIDPEWANRKRLLTGRKRLSHRNFTRMWNALIDEDPSQQILATYIGKEELRTLLSTVRVGGDPHLTRHRLHNFFAWCADSEIPELLTLATAVETW